jgi:hypothetical protein
MAAVGAMLSLGLPFATQYPDAPLGFPSGVIEGDPAGRGYVWTGWGLARVSLIDGHRPLSGALVALLVLTTATLVVLAGAALTHRTTQRIVPLTVMGAVLLVASVPLTRRSARTPLTTRW